MARYIGPKSRIARKFGEAIFGADKVLSSVIILPDSMVILVAARLPSTVSCWLRSRKLNILTVF